MIYRFHDEWYGSEAYRYRNELTTCTELSLRSPLSKLNDLVDDETRYEDTGKSLPNEAVDSRYSKTFGKLSIVTPILLHTLVLGISEDVAKGDNVRWNDATREYIPERLTNFISVTE